MHSEHGQRFLGKHVRMIDEIALGVLVCVRRHLHHPRIDALRCSPGGDINTEIDEYHDNHRHVEAARCTEGDVRSTGVGRRTFTGFLIDVLDRGREEEARATDDERADPDDRHRTSSSEFCH